jgi:hypothetical protein
MNQKKSACPKAAAPSEQLLQKTNLKQDKGFARLNESITKILFFLERLPVECRPTTKRLRRRPFA